MNDSTQHGDCFDSSASVDNDFDIINACECCNSRDFEDIQLLEQDLIDGTVPNAYRQCPEELRMAYFEHLGGQCRKGMLTTRQYMKNRYQSKHPERESFRQRPFPTQSDESSYNRWKFEVRREYEVQGNILYKKRGINPSLQVATPKNALFLIAKAHKIIIHGKTEATYHILKTFAYGIPRKDVEWFIKRCLVCSRTKTDKKNSEQENAFHCPSPNTELTNTEIIDSYCSSDSVSIIDRPDSPSPLVIQNIDNYSSGPNNMHSNDTHSGPWLADSLISDCSLWPTKKQYYTNMYEIPKKPMLSSTPGNGCKGVTKKGAFKGLVPYKLEKSKIVLFPEWYHLFIKRIARISPELNAYCKYSPAAFFDCFSGSRTDAHKVGCEIIKQFSDSFKENLGISFKDHKGFLFSRDFVENDYINSLKKHIDYTPMISRKNQLIQLARKGKFDPLVNFLQAYCLPEHAIWMQLLEVCLPNGVSEETRLDVAAKYEQAKKTEMSQNDWRARNSSTLFEYQICIFHLALEEDGFFPISDGSRNVQSLSSQIVKKRGLPLESLVPKKSRLYNDRFYRFPQQDLSSVGSRKRAFKEWCEPSRY